MNTLVIWYEPKAKVETKLKAELHFNLWKIKRKRSLENYWKSIKRTNWNTFFNTLLKGNIPKIRTEFFLDFGIMISNITNVDKICIYIPDQIKKENLADIGGVLQNNREVLKAVFNEELSCVFVHGSDKFSEVRDKNNKPKFNIYSVDIESDIEWNSYKGTILKIGHKIDPLVSEVKETYFRFRLTSSFVENISHTYVPNNSILEGFSSNTEIIDFRVNENRNIDASLLEKIKQAAGFNFSKIHFLILRSFKDDYVFSNMHIHGSRELEKKIWNSYISENEYEYSKVLAYHFKEVSKIKPDGQKFFLEDFNLLAKFKYENSNFLKILKYLLFFLIINTVYEIVANIISDHDGRRIIEICLRFCWRLVSGIFN